MNIFKKIYNYRELLKTNVKKETRGRYKNSILGVMWSFLNPLLQIVVYAIVFQLILKNPQENYAIFTCCGLIPWTFFSATISKAAFTMVENGNILKETKDFNKDMNVKINLSDGMIKGNLKLL